MAESTKHKDHSVYFMLYFTAMVINGINYVGLGSYIPYLTAATGIVETDNSFIFTARSAGMLLGAFLIKILQKRQFTNHQVFIIGLLIIGVFTIFFSMTLESAWLGTWLFIASIGQTIYEVSLNICILFISPPNEAQYWMLVGHRAFGVESVGGIVSPIFVYLFELHTFTIFGCTILLLVPLLLKMITPEHNGFTSEEKSSPKMKPKVISNRLEYCLGFMLFIYVGIECAYGGWLASFAVLSEVTNHQGATKFPSIFWAFLTIFRFVLAYAPGSSKQKLKRLIQGIVAVGILSLVIIHTGHTQFACYLSAVLFGLSYSSILPLIFTFPIEEGLLMEDSQAANITIAGVVAEGIVAMIIGKMMKWIHINMLFYSISFFAASLWFMLHYCLKLIVKQKEKNQILTELVPIIIKVEE